MTALGIATGQAVWALLVASAGNFLRRPKVRRTVEGVTGTVLIARWASRSQPRTTRREWAAMG
jgi:threonine/homoserine/homoserine lactone efflux protein